MDGHVLPKEALTLYPHKYRVHTACSAEAKGVTGCIHVDGYSTVTHNMTGGSM